MLRGIEDVDNDRQANRILAKIIEAVGGPLDSTLERDVRVIIYGWLAFTFEMCRQRIVDPSVDAGYVADSCAHSLLDGLARIPGIPTAPGDSVNGTCTAMTFGVRLGRAGSGPREAGCATNPESSIVRQDTAETQTLLTALKKAGLT